jgi:hypothetical protein
MYVWYRWKIEVHPYRHLGIRLPVQNMFMYNYLSVGVDAQVTLDFHRARESPFYIFSSRLINKVMKSFLFLYFALMPCWLTVQIWPLCMFRNF